MVNVRKDLTGMVFGRLTVMHQTEDYVTPKGAHQARWHCICSCNDHNEVDVLGSNLTKRERGTKSCGCLSVERTINMNHNLFKKYNEYDLSGEYGVGYCSNTNEPFYFDLEDYDKIKNYCWYELVNGVYHSLIAREFLSDNYTNNNIRMHQVLGYHYPDHINRNPLDNRKCNLRQATVSQNNMNKTVARNNTSGIIGVNWDKKLEKWKVSITCDKKRIHIGYFINKDDAIRARLIVEMKYFGEFSPQKHLFKQYGII